MRPRQLILAAAALCAAVSLAHADNGAWRTALSLYGQPKYPSGFTHFDYVNPDAPKGGTFREEGNGSFDTLNPFNIHGTPAAGLGLLDDTLMTQSLDEPYTEYGLLADGVKYPDDFSSVTYRLRPEAKFSDGTPVTPEDVIWTMQTLKASHPFYNAYYKHVKEGKVTGPHEVTFTFDETGNRELPQIVGEMVVLPKHYWTGKDPNGKPRDFTQTTLEPPVGSGPYRIKSISAGRTIVYQRRPDYWGATLNVNIGRNNFDQIRYDYYRDRDVSLQAFKADAYDFRIENSAKRWATAYDFPAVKNGSVILQKFRIKQAEPMQALVFNLRRAKFEDPRVREAFDLAFDFEWLNQNIFYGQYKRTDSFFEGTDLAATGLPTGKELAILNTVKDEVPPEVFTKVYKNPVGGTPELERQNLRKAFQLLREAGYVQKNGKLVNSKTGEPLTAEFLIDQPDTERVVAPLIDNLKRLGIQASIRLVDPTQYQQRMDTFDFDITTGLFQQSLSPGNEQRNYWGSAAASRNGSRNIAGIADPAVDTLIDDIVLAETRADLVAATRALDRVLLWHHYMIPEFYSPDIRTARWDRFGLPQTMPAYGFTTDTWWYDPAKAAKIKGGNG